MVVKLVIIQEIVHHVSDKIVTMMIKNVNVKQDFMKLQGKVTAKVVRALVSTVMEKVYALPVKQSII